MVPHLQAKKANMYASAKRGFATATDLADYLVRKGMAFRDAHEVVGLAVILGLRSQRDLSELSLPELQQFSPLITDEVFKYLTLEGSVAARKHIGGTAPDTVKMAIQTARQNMGAAT
jgi:argininosuccinate lyase